MNTFYLYICLIPFSFAVLGCGSGGSGRNEGGDSKEAATVEPWKVAVAGQEGHGGDAIVCFDIPLERALVRVDTRGNCSSDEPCQGHSSPIRKGHRNRTSGVFWKMTRAGRRAIASAKPLEQYLAERVLEAKRTLKGLNRMRLDEAYERVLDQLSELPAVYQSLGRLHDRLGWIESNGVADEFGLIDIDDSGFVTGIDQARCKELQAVIRRGSQLWYDPDIFAKFDTAGKLLIQLHEEIYAWGIDIDSRNRIEGGESHFTSTPTRRFILKLLASNPRTEILNQNLRELGFSILHWERAGGGPVRIGEYMTSQRCQQEQAYMSQFFINTNSMRHLDFLNMVINRYLMVSKGFVSEGLIYNYPDDLARLIDFTLRFNGGDSQFFRDAMPVFESFNQPSACRQQ